MELAAPRRVEAPEALTGKGEADLHGLTCGEFKLGERSRVSDEGFVVLPGAVRVSLDLVYEVAYEGS